MTAIQTPNGKRPMSLFSIFIVRLPPILSHAEAMARSLSVTLSSELSTSQSQPITPLFAQYYADTPRTNENLRLAA